MIVTRRAVLRVREMRERLARFSTLPVRPEYVQRVRAVLKARPSVPLADIIREARLTRNQTLSALDALMDVGAAGRKSKNVFWLIK